MKYVMYVLVFAFVFTSCKSNKNIVDANAVAKNMSAKKVARKHVSVNFDQKTVDAKLKVKFKNNKNNESFSVRMMIDKDKVIYLKGTKFITVFKVKITPTKVSYYSPYAKNYFEGDFSMLKEFLGTDINFEQLQNMLLGQALLDVKEEKQNVEIVANSHVLSPENQSHLFDIFFHVNPSHFKLDKQALVNSLKNQRLDISYPKYLQKDGEVFPENIVINAKENNKFTNIDMTVKSVVFNTDLKYSFKIPSGYKELNF